MYAFFYGYLCIKKNDFLYSDLQDNENSIV